MATRGDPAEAGDRTVVEMPNLQSIKTKKMRVKAFIEMKQMKRKLKMAKKRSVKEAIKKGEKVLKQLPQTIESLRIPDETMVNKDDEEIMLDEATDELAAHFQRQTSPKILITTSYKHHMRTKLFCKELEKCLPSAEYYHRKGLKLKRIIPQAVSRDFTDLIIINEDQKTPNAFLLIHLPNGPTAHFKLTSVCLCKEIKKVGELTGHRPELILNNFNTRLGHTVGRVLASLFPLDPQFIGRRVITFHNQRDFIFFRHHRYVFRNEKRVGLQELGPRFTLKLRSLQKGTFDSKYGEYEWVHKRHEMETSRRKFFV